MSTSRDAVLVVDDDVAIGKVLVSLLGQRGLDATHVASADEALRAIRAGAFDVVLSDVRMPGMDGLVLLDRLKTEQPEMPVILLTAHGSVAVAVDAMKRGAADFVQKPFDKDEIGFVVEKALAGSKRAREGTPRAILRQDSMIGEAPSMKSVFATIQKVAPSNATVLVRGETGTGKELVARALHDASPRRSEPFVQVHCAALPQTLLESELFGHEKGAFTGATQQKPGRVELAHRGTMLLDEIGDVPLEVQVKLLRVLQERALERVGGTQTIRVDVRFVAATHRDLEAMVAAGTFREDLFYRLAVVPITIPPLRERPGDVERLARHFVETFGEAPRRRRLDEGALAALSAERWPGNVRQLQNFVERLVVLSDADVITRADVEREIGRPRASNAPAGGGGAAVSLDARRKESEKDALVRALAQVDNNRTRAARLLEISRRTLYNKLREHGLE